MQCRYVHVNHNLNLMQMPMWRNFWWEQTCRHNIQFCEGSMKEIFVFCLFFFSGWETSFPAHTKSHSHLIYFAQSSFSIKQTLCKIHWLITTSVCRYASNTSPTPIAFRRWLVTYTGVGKLFYGIEMDFTTRKQALKMFNIKWGCLHVSILDALRMVQSPLAAEVQSTHSE